MKKRILTTILTTLFVSSLVLTGCGSDSGSSTPVSTEPSTETNETSENNTQEVEENNENDTQGAQEGSENDLAKIVEGGDLIFGSATELNDFDPFASITADVRGISFNIFEGLVKVASDGSFLPAVAEDYEISEDAKTYTFILRSGVKFHNGNEVTPDDVLYSIQTAIDTATNGYDQIESFEINEEGRLVIQLSESNAGFIAYLTQAIVPKDAENLSLKPVGTGPYKLTEYVEQDHIKLEKNEDYWGTPGHLDSITVKFLASQSDLVLNLQAGSIDGFSADAGIASQVNENEVNRYEKNSNAVQLLALNNEFEPFQDVRVRKALNYIVDSQEIIDIVNYGYGTKLGSGLIPALTKYYDETLADVYDKDLDKAKELLEEAGYVDGFSFTITVPSVYTVHVNTAEVIVNQLAEAGITADIQQVDWATWLENVYQGRQYEATIISLDGSLAYPTAFLARYVSDSGSNFVNFNSEAYDEAYNKAITALDEDEKVQYFKEAQQILNEEAASVYIQDIEDVLIYNKNFEGYLEYPLYATDLSVIYQVQQ